MSTVRSDCMYCACLYNLHSTNSQISTWVRYWLRRIFIPLFSSLMRFNALWRLFIMSLGICDSSHWGTVTYNQPTHHKIFPVHGVTKPTLALWYCEPVHYFADSDWFDSWTHLLIPSNNPSQWTDRKTCRLKGCQNQTLMLNTITSNDWVNSVHQLLVNNV